MSAKKLALKIMPLFRLCDEQLSQQNRYNVTLRELKLSNIFEVGNLAERYQLPGLGEDVKRYLETLDVKKKDENISCGS